MTEIGKAYIQIVPSMQGFGDQVKSTISSQSGNAGDSGGKTFGEKFKSAAGAGIKAVGAGITAAAAAGVALAKQSIDAYKDYEQLSGGAEKIFSNMDTSKILSDAQNAWRDMNLSANEYLSMMNSVGATFKQTMGDQKGYETAKTGMQAIADYASGTGRSVSELNDKYAMITRSTSSYQSIADQFSGILPATSADFLKQAQAAGFLSGKYTELTKVPVAEYQEAVTKMLEKGVADMGLAGNTANETANTISGSLAGMKASWSNLVVGLADDNSNMQQLVNDFVENVVNTIQLLGPRIEVILNNIGPMVQQIGSTLIPVIVNAIVSNLPQLVQAGVQLIVTLAGALVQALPQLIAAIPEIFRALVNGFQANWPQIQQAGRDIINQLGNTLRSLGSQALNWGKDLIQNFINGIKSKLSAVGEAVSSVAQKAASYLHFSEPDEGPLSNFHTFAPDMMRIFADGITRNIGTVKSALNGLTGMMADEMGGENGVNALRAGTYTASRSAAAASGTGETQTIVKVKFEGSMAPLAMILQPLIEVETVRVGESYAPA